MKQLLKDQDVEFHSHNAGNSQEELYGKGLHIHKTMKGNNHAGVQIIIPIDSSEKIRWQGTSISKKEKEKLISEINNVLKESRKVREFAKKMCEVIKRYTNKSQNIDENIEDGFKRVAKLLGFKSEIIKFIETEITLFKENEQSSLVEEKKSIYTAFLKDKNSYFYVTLDEVEEAIKAGQIHKQCIYCNHLFNKKIEKNYISESCSMCIKEN